MRFVDLPVTIFDQHTGVAVANLNQVCGKTDRMAGDRVGRMNKGPRKTQSVRFPLDHFDHYAKQAEALRIPVGEYVAYRIAVIDGLKIPDQVLLANPGLVHLLPEADQREALQTIPRLAERYAAAFLNQSPDQLSLDDLITLVVEEDARAA